MAYVDVTRWEAKEVIQWLQGLDDVIQPYAHFFHNNNVSGQDLLNLTVDDLYKLHVEKLGHQEIILEALDMLKNLHYNLDTENLQYVSLRLSCRARSLCNEIRMFGHQMVGQDDKQLVLTTTMSAVADVLDSAWTVINWLERDPFGSRDGYRDVANALSDVSVRLATTAQRDRFAEKPVDAIVDCCERLANLADSLVTETLDSLVIQPTFLTIATARKKATDDSCDFGFVLERGPPGAPHVIKEVRLGSAAHSAGRIEAGDEIVQVGYQTVVGWQAKKVLKMCEGDGSNDLILTLRKRPRHSPLTFGQIYIKPFRIPGRQKKNLPNNYFNNLPSPRVELLVAPNISFPKRSKGSSKKSLERRQSEASSSPEKAKKKPLLEDTDCNQSPSPPKLPPKNPKPSGEKPPPPPRGSLAVSAATAEDSEEEEEEEEVGGEREMGSASSDEDSSSSSVDIDVDFEGSDDDDEAFYAAADARSILGKSPTQSIRSALSRPRSAPLRRNTISGTSSSQYPAYINISEILQQVKKQQQGQSQCDGGSNSSTLQSRDSGLSTLSSTNTQPSSSGVAPDPPAKPPHSASSSKAMFDQLRSQSLQESSLPPPPAAVRLKERAAAAYVNLGKIGGSGGASNYSASIKLAPPPSSVRPPLPSSSSSGVTSLDSGYGATSSPSSRDVLARLRGHRSFAGSSEGSPGGSEKNDLSPPKPLPPSAKKRPIPQPRRTPPSRNTSLREGTPHPPPSSPASGHNSSASSAIKSSLKSLLPNPAPQPVPVPGANFVSYKKVVPQAPPQGQARRLPPSPSATKTPEKSGLPEYINTTPPAVPARNPNTSLSSPAGGGVRPKAPPLMSMIRDDIPLPTSAPPPRPSKPSTPIGKPTQPQPSRPSPGVVLRSKSSSNFVLAAGAAALSVEKERRHSGDSGGATASNRHGVILDKTVIPYYVGDVSKGGEKSPRRDETTPEKQWIDSLRRREHLEPEDEEEDARRHPVLRSAHNYRPIRQQKQDGGQGAQGQQQQLKMVFDMDLGAGSAANTDGSLREDFNVIKTPQETQQQQQQLPPLFNPDSYNLQDYSRRRQQQQQQGHQVQRQKK